MIKNNVGFVDSRPGTNSLANKTDKLLTTSTRYLKFKSSIGEY